MHLGCCHLKGEWWGLRQVWLLGHLSSSVGCRTPGLLMRAPEQVSQETHAQLHGLFCRSLGNPTGSLLLPSVHEGSHRGLPRLKARGDTSHHFVAEMSTTHYKKSIWDEKYCGGCLEDTVCYSLP